MSNKIIELKGLTKNFDDQQVLKGIDLNIYENEFLTLLGPSGCGKTTILRIIAGFEEPSKGELLFNGIDISKVPPYKREINTVFQKYALFPFLNVHDNVAFGLNLKKVDKSVVDQKVSRMLKLVGLEGFEKRDVTLLSGGQQQRVAIARALVNEPKVLLLDEPLGALDAKLRKEMQFELKKIQKEVGITFIFVTHDQEEALSMSDTVVVMNNGIIQQIDTPQNLYERPGNKFVAGFLGSPQMNFIDGVLKKKNNGYCVQFAKKYELAIPAAKEDKKLANYVDKEVVLGIRPEAIHDDEMFLSTATTGIIECDVDITEMMGAENFLYLDCQGTPLTARVDPRSTAKQGDKNLKVALDPNRMHLFDKETEETIIN